MDKVYDVAIIGGGINGCGCAADAALRGLSVILCEKDDIASKTSSSSTKLIHGGLRYLEHYDFSMVKKAQQERHILMQIAPYLVKPLGIVLPYKKNRRPIWLLRIGLFIYDHLTRKNTLPKTRLIQRKLKSDYFKPLINTIKKGFIYFDCTADDARLTIANALQAKEHGATILTRSNVTEAVVKNNHWVLTIKPQEGAPFQIKAKAVVNAAGPWAAPVNQLLSITMHHRTSLVKGSHLMVNKLYEGNHAYLLQHDDERVVFVIPYHGYTMIGTTDIVFDKPIDTITIDPAETDYLLDLVSLYFKRKIKKDDIIGSWSGIRPLIAADNKKPNALSRDYVYKYTLKPAPAVTIYSGKITTYRQLAAEVVTSFKSVFPELVASNTSHIPLPGACINDLSFTEYQKIAKKRYKWLDADALDRYLNTYGTRTEIILKEKNAIKDLGIQFADTLYQAEIDYLIQDEWAHTLEDVLWRRTKLGLSMDKTSQQKLDSYLRFIQG